MYAVLAYCQVLCLCDFVSLVAQPADDVQGGTTQPSSLLERQHSFADVVLHSLGKDAKVLDGVLPLSFDHIFSRLPQLNQKRLGAAMLKIPSTTRFVTSPSGTPIDCRTASTILLI